MDLHGSTGAQPNRRHDATSIGRLAVTFGKGSLWVARAGGSQVERIGPSTGKVISRLHPHAGIELAVVGSGLWTITQTGTIHQLGNPL
jgi:hypothetical protein